MRRGPTAAAPPTVVVKLGGREMAAGADLLELADRLRPLARAGRLVLVHGGGDEVTARADALGLPTTRHRGQRVTSPPMLEVVVEVLAGRINARLVAALSAAGLSPVGLSGASAGLLSVVPAGSPPGALGLVGRPRRANPRLLTTLLAEGHTPVVAPIGLDRRGALYNVNADLAAAAIAESLRAPLWILTDVDGVRGPDGTRRPRLDRAEAERLILEGIAQDGMVPKLEAALARLRAGAPGVWLGRAADLTPEGPRPGRGTWVGEKPARPKPPAPAPWGTAA